MKPGRRWAYVIGLLALSVALAALFGRFTPNWLLRGPAAQPGPTAEAPSPAPPPKATVPQGMQPLQPKIEDGVKTYDLVVQRVQWDVGGEQWKEAYAVNGMVPGPEIRVTEGERVRFRVKNELDEPTSMHWHGIILPPEQDGVAHLSQDPIMPGETFVYDYKPGPPGTHWYHSHFNGAKQVSLGVYGPLIVVPRDPNHPTHPSQYDVDHIIMINDTGLGLTMNGKGFPHNLPMKVAQGQRVLIRMVNVGIMAHPMHLHGHDFRIVAKDGNPIAQPMLWNTTNIAPGETYDMAFAASNPGSWLFHCHILPHAEGPDGMFGLTALLEYNGFEPDPSKPHQHGQVTPNRLPGTPGKHEH